MIRRAVAGVAVAVGIAVATPAFAQTPGADTIVLKNGGLYRGTLIEVLPNDHARIRLDTGEIATVPWSEIDHVDASTPVSTATPAPLPAPSFVAPNTPSDAVKPPTPPAESRVFVHITGAPDAVLETGAGQSWTTVCTSPCDEWVPTDGGYRIGGPGVRDSTAFGLTGSHGDHVNLKVDAASQGAFIGGAVAASTGYTVLPIGLMLLAVGAGVNSCSQSATAVADGVCSSGDGLVLAGAITSIVGAVGGTIGLIATFSNLHTTVAQTNDGSTGEAPPPVSLRLPAWQETRSAAKALPAMPATVPLYTFEF